VAVSKDATSCECEWKRSMCGRVAIFFWLPFPRTATFWNSPGGVFRRIASLCWPPVPRSATT